MLADALQCLALAAIASGAAIVLVLMLRKPMRQHFGPDVAYALWAIVPTAAVIALLPAPIGAMPASAAASAAGVLPSPAAGQLANAPSFDPQPWLAALWLAGVIVFALLLGMRQRRYVRALGVRSRLSAGVQRAQASAGCPALIGAWRPRIVLPADFRLRFSALERRLILAHEQLHRVRGDAQLNLIAALLRCLFWFNPLVHFAASRYRFDQELACDARVIARFPGQRRLYAGAMLKTQFADDPRLQPGLPVGCYWQSSHPLKERIAMLKQPLPGLKRRVCGYAVTAVLSAAGSYAAWATQPPAIAAPASQPADSSRTGGDNDRPATYRSMRRIAYPQRELAARIEGVVYLTLRIAADGRVEPVDAKAEPNDAGRMAGLIEAARSGVQAWTFNPAVRAGRPVSSEQVVPIVFALRPDHVPPVNAGTLDAIRVSPPDEAGLSSADRPPSEDVTFRQMHPPKYPVEAVREKQSARLQFKVLVDEHGTPQTVDVAASDPPEAGPMFAQASIEAIMQWRFNPALKDGKPQPGYVLVPIDFTISEDD